MVPAIYDNGTHFVTNQKPTFEMLREISDSDDILEVAGDYTGNITARGPSHVHSDDCPLRNLDYAYQENRQIISSSNEKQFTSEYS